MAEYEELIEALRHCYEDDDACATCQRWLAHDEWGIKCKGRLISDAAAAIEALQAQLPKRGKWKPFDLTYGRSIYSCSVCEQATEVPMCMEKPMYAYCPYCGSKMEVQE